MPTALTAPLLHKRVRKLQWLCLSLWFGITLLPLLAASATDRHIGSWPLPYWLAAQGCLLGYLAIVVVYASLVNRWERQAGTLSFELPRTQDD
jgi:putative solute:sodium symporter small subunit